MRRIVAATVLLFLCDPACVFAEELPVKQLEPPPSAEVESSFFGNRYQGDVRQTGQGFEGFYVVGLGGYDYANGKPVDTLAHLIHQRAPERLASVV